MFWGMGVLGDRSSIIQLKCMSSESRVIWGL